MRRWTPTPPSTWPGARPPSLFLKDGRAIFDLFGAGFTLLRFADIDVAPIVAAAADLGVPLDVVDLRDSHACHLYQRDLVLIRPDQHVAWRATPFRAMRAMSSTACEAPRYCYPAHPNKE